MVRGVKLLIHKEIPYMPLELENDSESVWAKVFANKTSPYIAKKVREKSRGCHNNKPQPFPDTKRKRKQTKPNKRKSNKLTESTKISFLFLMRGNRNAQRTENHRNKITLGKT